MSEKKICVKCKTPLSPTLNGNKENHDRVDSLPVDEEGNRICDLCYTEQFCEEQGNLEKSALERHIDDLDKEEEVTDRMKAPGFSTRVLPPVKNFNIKTVIKPVDEPIGLKINKITSDTVASWIVAIKAGLMRLQKELEFTANQVQLLQEAHEAVCKQEEEKKKK